VINLTFRIGRPRVTILRRMLQPKDCIAASRMRSCLRHRSYLGRGDSLGPFRLRSQPREDTGLSPAEAVFGPPLVFPNEVCRQKSFPLIKVIKNFPSYKMPRFFLCLASTTRAASCQRRFLGASSARSLSGCTAAASSPPAVALRQPLRHPAPWLLLLHHPSQGLGMRSSSSAGSSPACTRSQTMQSGTKRQPPSTDMLAKLANACCGGPPAPRRVSFSDPLVSTPSHQEQPRVRLGTVFPQPHRGFLHALGRLLLTSLHSSGTRSTSGDHQRGSTSDLTFYEARARGEPCGDPGYAPGPN
jgi:hypothetical protein